MDVISEIKKFEQFPDRPNFSDLQVNDFFKKLVDHPLTFEAMVTSVKRGSRADYEIQADTYKYSVIHNPVSGRDFVSWAPDISFVCECKEDVLKFNPITDLIKGDRFHSSATFIGKEDKEIRVKLTSFKKLQFLEVELEKNLLQKRFESNFKEASVYAPQRQYQKRTFNIALTYFGVGAFIGGSLGLMTGAVGFVFGADIPFLEPGIEGALVGGGILGVIGMIRGLLRASPKM